jgi:large subunit ribosomal protein L31
MSSSPLEKLRKGDEEVATPFRAGNGVKIPLKRTLPKMNLVSLGAAGTFAPLFRYMKADIHPRYVQSEMRCACGNVIETRSTKPQILLGICNACHPFYTGQQKFVDTAGRVDKFQQRLAKTQAAQAAQAEANSKKKKA